MIEMYEENIFHLQASNDQMSECSDNLARGRSSQ